MRVLAIMAHPDDMELGCSGTLIKCKKRGDDVIVCHGANGNMGHMVILPDELRRLRIKEAQNAAAIAGFEVVTADIGDLTISSANEEQVKKIIGIVRYAKPDVIITHSPNDYCSDHTELSKIVFSASFSASCPHFFPHLGNCVPVTPLFFADTSRHFHFQPTEYVDITEVMDIKEKMLSCHESQLKWLLEHDHIDILEIQRAQARLRGLQCETTYAEGFIQLMASQRVRCYRILP